MLILIKIVIFILLYQDKLIVCNLRIIQEKNRLYKHLSSRNQIEKNRVVNITPVLSRKEKVSTQIILFSIIMCGHAQFELNRFRLINIFSTL